MKRICTTSKDFNYHCKKLKQRFLEQGYDSELLGKHINTVEKLDRNKLIKGDKKALCTRIPLAITYNRLLKSIIKIYREIGKESS